MDNRQEVRPKWEQRLRDELFRERPERVLIYDALFGHFGGDCSAPQLIRYLLKQGHKPARDGGWLPCNRDSMGRLIRQLKQRRAVASAQADISSGSTDIRTR